MHYHAALLVSIKHRLIGVTVLITRTAGNDGNLGIDRIKDFLAGRGGRAVLSLFENIAIQLTACIFGNDLLFRNALRITRQ
ncbi:MAG: hypothetical protein J6V39_06655, partial [Clostridia bacterium]|nr:hypothetical protein [Clostridia bacterium]